MLLKQLKISGFKSFADSYTINFPKGLTAIVGPNGSGKSNIIDAIRWVLGEQRVKMLRSEKMEDVIFSGTIRRKPHNFTEVLLTIENDKKVLPVEYDMVSITRRIFRTGESEYRLNKKLCRLKDITALFYDTGMGIGSYSLMEQKMIDTILSDKDEERRIMFEEASGIHKYRNQRKEALRNLLKTSDDLQRISDLVMEKERMVKMLARHVTKAKKYREYSDELTRLDVALCSRRFRDQSEKIKEISRAHATLITEKEKLSAQVATAETMIEEKELFVLEKEEKLRQSNQAVREITEQIHTIENSMVSKQEKIEGAKRAIQQIDLYQNKSKETINKLKEEHAFIEGEIITFETKIKEAEAAYTACKSEFDQFEQEVAKKRLELNKTNQQKINLMEEEAELRSRREKVKSTSDMLLESKMNIQRSIGEEKKHLDECHEQIRKYKASLKEVSEEHENLSASREALLVKIDEKEDKYKSIFEEEKTLEATLISDEKKLEFVEEMKKNHEGYKEAVRSVIEGNISGISGIVADIINVDPAYMVPIEAALGSRVQYVLADSEGAAQAAIDYLREGKLGKASFVIHNAVKGVNRPAHLEDLGHIEGVIGWADNFVTFQRNYEALGSLLLGDVLLIKDIAVMEKVKATCGDFTVYCLTPDGRSFTTHGIVRGGFGSEELGLLSRTKFIEHLNESINRCKSQIDSKEREKKASLLTIEEAKKALLEIDEWLNADRRAKQEHEGNIRHLDEEIMRIQARENDALEQIHAIDRRLEEVHEEEKQIERSLEIMDEKKTETESIILISAEILDQFEEKRHTMTEKLKNAEIEFSSVKQEMENRKRELGRVADSINHAYETLTADKEARNKSEIEIETLRKEIEDIKVQHSELSIVKREKEQNAGKRHEDLAVLRNEIGEFRKAEREKEKTLNAAKDKLHECEMNLERLTERRRNMVERIYEEYERDLNSLTEEETRIEMDENEAKEKIEVLRKRLKQIGPNVNLGVLEDYERENKTFEELSRQKADLEEAKAKLEKLIRRLDKEACEKFIRTFDQVNENFRNVFLSLFEGGEAEIRLEEDPDPLKAKITVYARPSGKSMKNISLLSGGERALTATSLLFGLYLVKRSPYCILDEVDGPLDDANIGRFIKLIRQFSNETQFIIITHNKKTMAECDLLYGVTPAEPGISKMVSVSLATDEKMIDALIAKN